MARLGIATLQIQAKKYDQAIAALTTLSQRADADVPVDAVLMQLGDAYQRAGRTPDAVKTFTRVVDEFPQSPYLHGRPPPPGRSEGRAAPPRRRAPEDVRIQPIRCRRPEGSGSDDLIE